MATLMELKAIETAALADPGSSEGELRQKVEVAIWKIAQAYLAQTSLPADPQERNEAIGWAQQTLRNSSAMVDPVFRAILAGNSDAAVTTILAVSDTAIENAVGGVITMLARGRHPGQP